MKDDVKKLSLPGKEAERAAALRENLKKRKTQTRERTVGKSDDVKSTDRE